MKSIAVINDLSGFGRCSLTAAIPVISACGAQCCPLPTAVLSNQTGYDSYYCDDFTNKMPLFFAEWEKLNPAFDAILTGFIAGSRQGALIEQFIKTFQKENTLLVVDPVMADNGSIYDFYTPGMVQTVKQLAMHADIVTPNLSELYLLAGEDCAGILTADPDTLQQNAAEYAKRVLQQGVKTVIVSGIPAKDGQLANGIFTKDGAEFVLSGAMPGSFSGTGDLFVSVVTAKIVCGTPVQKAVEIATDFIYRSICRTIESSDGKPDYKGGIEFESFLHLLWEEQQHG